jgi:hypothetical protein
MIMIMMMVKRTLRSFKEIPYLSRKLSIYNPTKRE